MTKDDMFELHEWYTAQLKDIMGVGYTKDYSVRGHGAWGYYLLLEKYQPKAIAEFGAGLTTLIAREWADRNGARLYSFDHDESWLDLITEVQERRGLKPKNMHPISWIKDTAYGFSSPWFDFAFVDHGPNWRARWDDLPFITSIVSDDGVLVLDDWRPPSSRKTLYHQVKKARNTLNRMGWQVEPFEPSRPEPTDKALAVAIKGEKPSLVI